MTSSRPRAAALIAAGLVLLAGCGAGGGDGSRATPDLPPAEAGPLAPRRVISLDYCADQYALKFLEREQILALSPDARADYSYMRDAAAGLPHVQPVAEDVLVRRPDAVIRSYGGGPNAARLLANAGIRVVQIGHAADLAAVRRNVLEVTAALGVAARGRAVVADMDRRLAAVRERVAARRHDAPTALYLTPAGVTAGEGTLIDAMFAAAGLDNFQGSPGWQPIPLERLAYTQPDLAVPGFFGSSASRLNAWTSIHHPVVRHQLSSLPTLPVQGAWTACAGWFLVDAVEALAGTPRPPAKASGAGG